MASQNAGSAYSPSFTGYDNYSTAAANTTNTGSYPSNAVASSGSIFNPVTVGLGAGTVTAGALYKFGTNPISDGKLAAGMTDEFSTAYTQAKKAEIYKSQTKNKVELTDELLEEIKNCKNKEDLSKTAKKYIKGKDFATVQADLKTVTADIEKIDINLQRSKLSQIDDLKTSFTNNATARKTNYTKLFGDNIEDLSSFGKTVDGKLVVDPKLVDGFINGSSENRIKLIKDLKTRIARTTDKTKVTELKNLRQSFIDQIKNDRSEMRTFLTNNSKQLGLYDDNIDEMTKKINECMKNPKTELNNKISSMYRSQKAATSESDHILGQVTHNISNGAKHSDELINAATKSSVKSFKLKSASKWGLIAAGVVAVGAMIFGGNKQAA